MINITDKIIQLDKPNGIFIVFCEFDSEDFFNSFLKFLKKNLNANIIDVRHHPYSQSAYVKFPFGEATAICQEGIGCAIRIDPGQDKTLKELIERCSNIG